MQHLLHCLRSWLQDQQLVHCTRRAALCRMLLAPRCAHGPTGEHRCDANRLYSSAARREAAAAAADIPDGAAFDASLRRSAHASARPRSVPACTPAGAGDVIADWRTGAREAVDALPDADTAEMSDAERWALKRAHEQQRATTLRSGVRGSFATEVALGRAVHVPAADDAAAAARRSHDFASSAATRARVGRRMLAFGAPPPHSASVGAEHVMARCTRAAREEARRLLPERLLLQGVRIRRLLTNRRCSSPAGWESDRKPLLFALRTRSPLRVPNLCAFKLTKLDPTMVCCLLQVRITAAELQQAWARALAHQSASSSDRAAALEAPLTSAEAAALVACFDSPGSHTTWPCRPTVDTPHVADTPGAVHGQLGLLVDDLVEAVVAGEAHQLARQPVVRCLRVLPCTSSFV